MTVAHENIPPSTFPQPEGIVSIEVDYKSGLLPSASTPPQYIVTEKFNSAYLPAEVSNVWVQQPVCADTGKLLTNSCPTAVTKIFLKRQVPWTGGIAPEDASLEAPKEYCPLHGSGQQSVDMSFYLQGLPLIGNNNEVKIIKLSWHYPLVSSNTVFTVYRSDQPGVALTPQNKIAQVGAGTTSWQDGNITPGHRYHYVVVAQNPQSSEQSRSSNEIEVLAANNAHTTSGLKAPKLNGEAHINGSNVSVRLYWSKASDNRPIVYYIFRSETPNFQPNPGNQIAVDKSITGTEWTDTGLSREKKYYYRVIGFDLQTNQQSPVSNQLQVIIP